MKTPRAECKTVPLTSDTPVRRRLPRQAQRAPEGRFLLALPVTAPSGLTALASEDGDMVILGFPVPVSKGSARAEELTAAESSVLQHLLGGLSNSDIAKQRSAAVRTVANQVASIFRKLGVSSRSELLASSALVRAEHATRG